MSTLLIYVLLMFLVIFLYSKASVQGRIIMDFLFVISNMYGFAVFLKTGMWPFAIIAAFAIIVCAMSIRRNLDVLTGIKNDSNDGHDNPPPPDTTDVP